MIGLIVVLLTFLGGWWVGAYGFSTLEVDAILIYLLFYYCVISLFILGKKSIYNKI